MKILSTIALSVLAFAAAASAQVVVTPANTQGWDDAETGGGGSVNFVRDETSPGIGAGALQLKTDGSATARAQYQHETQTLLSAVNELSYYTKQVSGAAGVAAPAYQLETCLNGATPTSCSGYTTLNFEPYQNPEMGPIVQGQWRFWDVDQGKFWSSRTVTCGTTTITGGPGGSGGLYTLQQLQTACPNAVVFNHYVNIGTGVGAWDVYVDLVNFNGTVYDFEPFLVPTDKEQCKQGGWANLFRRNGRGFKNQGDCISYVNNGRGDRQAEAVTSKD